MKTPVYAYRLVTRILKFACNGRHRYTKQSKIVRISPREKELNNVGIFHSPAFLPPICTKNRVYLVTPDYFITCFDSRSGKIIWHESKKDMPVWFSRGLSKDSSVLYVKAMNSKGFGVSTISDSLQVVWKGEIDMNGDAAITPIEEDGDLVYFSSNYSEIVALNKIGSKICKHKISNSAINMIKKVDNCLYASTVDGKLVSLSVN